MTNCWATTYEELKNAVEDSDRCSKALQSVPRSAATSTEVFLQDQPEMNRKQLFRPFSRVRNMEWKIVTLTEQLSSLTLMIKKSHAALSNTLPARLSPKESWNIGHSEIKCSCCRKPDPVAKTCPENPNCDKHYPKPVKWATFKGLSGQCRKQKSK